MFVTELVGPFGGFLDNRGDVAHPVKEDDVFMDRIALLMEPLVDVLGDGHGDNSVPCEFLSEFLSFNPVVLHSI